MTTVFLDQPQLRARGFEVLVNSLGWVNAVRFVQQYESSRLNYTTERDAIVPDMDADELMRQLDAFEIPTAPPKA